MKRSVSVLLSSSSVLAFVFACSSESQPSSAMMRTRSCVKTACEARIEHCDAWLDDCKRSCDSIDDPYLNLACYEACYNHDCSCSDVDYDLCDTWGYEFTLPQPGNPRLYQACARAAQRNADCGEPPLARDCDVAARVEDPARADVYDCVADAACGASLRACADSVPVGTLGREYCATRATCAEEIDPNLECDSGEAAALDAESGWLNDRAIRAARGCFAEVCADVVACMTAWQDAVQLGRSASVDGSSASAASSSSGGAGGDPNTFDMGGSTSWGGAGGSTTDTAGWGGATDGDATSGGAGGATSGGAGGAR